MEHFVITVNGFQLIVVITKHSILDVAAVLDPLLYFFSDALDHYFHGDSEMVHGTW